MKKKLKIELGLLILAAIFLSSSSISSQTVAQESIDITSHGCSACSLENNIFWVNWTYMGTIPFVSIYLYNLSYTTIEYTVVENTMNIGSYAWSFPKTHTLDGEYYLVVCDAGNHNVNDSVSKTVYPIQDIGINLPGIPGYPILVSGLIIGITSFVTVIILTKKMRKK